MADRFINHSEEGGPAGYDPMQSAFEYAKAAQVYATCAKGSHDRSSRARFDLYSGISSDMAAVRFVLAHEEPEVLGAYIMANSQISKAKPEMRYAKAHDKQLFDEAVLLISESPEKQ